MLGMIKVRIFFFYVMNSKFFVIFQYINNKKSCYKNYSTYVLKHVFSNICHKTVEFSKIGEFLKKSLPGIYHVANSLITYISADTY